MKPIKIYIEAKERKERKKEKQKRNEMKKNFFVMMKAKLYTISWFVHIKSMEIHAEMLVSHV